MAEAGAPEPSRSPAPGPPPTRRTAVAAALVVALLAAVAYRHFLLLDRVFLFTDVGSDTVNALYPMWVHLADTLRAGHLPGWTFRLGLGQDVFPNALGNPFDGVLLLLGRDRLPYAIAYLEVAKLTLAGGLFCAFLRRLGLAPGAALPGGVLYAFSGFMVVGGSWVTFSTEGVYLALLLFAFERYLAERRWGLVVLAFFLIAAGRPFNLVNNGLFLALYAAVRHVDRCGWRGGGGAWGVAALVARLAGLGVAGAALAGVFLLPAVNEMSHSFRVSGVLGRAAVDRLMDRPPLALARAVELKSALYRLFGNDLLGRGTAFTGSRQYLDAPLLYVGLPVLLLVPQAFAGTARRRRWIAGGALALAAVLVVFPYPRAALWLFAVDYYRILGFMAALAPLLLAAGALSRILRGGPVRLPLLGITLAVLLAALFIPWPPADAHVAAHVRWLTAGLLAAYAVAIAALGRARWRPAAGGLLAALVAAEVLLLATPGATARPVLSARDLAAKTGYNDFSADAAAWMRRTDPGLYRAEKTFSSSPSDYTLYRNDPLVQGYRGTSAYHRFNNPSYLRFLFAVDATDGLAKSLYRALAGVPERALLHPFLGIRYLVTRFPDTAALAAWEQGAPPGLVETMYAPVARFGDVVVYRDRWALPLGFTYDRYLDYRSFLALPRAGRERALYYAFVPDPQDADAVRGLGPLDLSQPAFPLAEAVAARARGGLDLTEAGPERLTGTLTTAGPVLLALTIPQDPGWRARVDGAPARLHPVNFGFMGLPLGPGRHTVALTYRPPWLAAGAGLSGVGAVALAGMVLWGRRRASGAGPRG